MKKIKRKNIVSSVLIGILFIVSLAAMLFGLFIPQGGGTLSGSLNKGETEERDAITAEAATVTYPTAGKLGQFPVGYTYTFTSKDLVEGYRNGSESSDLETVKVENVAHGLQKNPYVIATAADWNKFAELTLLDTDSAPYGQGEYFVLANDIDFTGVTVLPVPLFRGTFYGMGHTLSNITISSWTTYTGAALPRVAYGLFGQTFNSTITDLVVKDFSYQNPPNAVAYSDGTRGSCTGGIVGWSVGNDSFLNCHASGTFSSTVLYTIHVPLGGIVGWASSVSTTVYTKLFYRCSAEITSDLKTNASIRRVIILGGILGESYYTSDVVKVYDCAANAKQTTTASGQYGLYMGSLVGISGARCAYTIDGFVGSVDVKSETNLSTYSGALMGYFCDASGTWRTPALTAKNCYTDGIIRRPDGNKALYMIQKNASPPVNNTTLSNLNYSTNGNAYCAFAATDISNYSTVPQAVSSSADLYSAAKSAVGSALNSNIWNASKIGGTYDPDNSPVRNYMTIVPTDIEMEYTGENRDVTDAPWYMEGVHGNTDIMTIAYPSGGMANAGEYNVTFNLKSDFTWNDGAKGAKTIKVRIRQKKLTIDWDTSNGAAVAKISGGLVNKDLSNPPAIIHTYYNTDGSLVGGDGRIPETIGTYTVKATLGEGENYKLKENETDKDPEFTFQLTAIPIKTPTVSGNASHQYTGEGIVFTLANDDQMGAEADGFKIEEITQANMPNGAVFEKKPDEDGIIRRTITVKTVGTYTVKFTLHDQTNNCWGEGGGVLRLTVTQRPIELNVERGGGWQFETNTNESFTVTASGAVAGDNIQLAITYEKPNGEIITVGNDKMKKDTENPNKTIVTLDPLDAGDHVIRVGLASATASNSNGNYRLESIVEQNVEVVGKLVTLDASDIEWQYSDGRNGGTLASDTKLSYNGRTFTASIKTDQLAAKGVRIKEYVEDAENGYSATGINAGSYKTKVILTKLNDTYNFTDREFEIAWTISPTVFDLSDVYWNYTGPIGYTGKAIKVELVNVPNLLTATYSGNVEMDVTGGGSYTATVSFKPKNEAERNNYMIPSGEVSSGTYLYKEGATTFPWTLKWQIKKGVIDLNWDLDGKEATGKDGYPYTYPTLLGGGDYVEYKLYKAVKDNSSPNGYVPETNETPFDAVAEPAADVKKEWYFVAVTLKSGADDNFEFGDGDEVFLFAIGDYRDPVRVTVTKSGGMYDGLPKPIEFTFDALSRSDFEVTYLNENGVVLSGAPTDAGKYTARITIRGAKEESHYVVGKTHEFEITKFRIDPADLTWDYTVPFEFLRERDEERIYTVKLANVPETLELVYTNNAYSAAGKYTATVAFGDVSLIDTDNIDISNFWNSSTNRYEFPAAIRELEWEITKHSLKRPSSIADLTYNGTDYNLIELIGLDADWAQYLTVTIRKGMQTVTETVTSNAGKYTITCTPIGSLRNSVVWSDGTTIDKTVTVTIDPMYIKVTGWEGKPAVPKFEGDVGSSYYDVIYRNGSESGDVIPEEAVETTYNVEIYASVEVSAAMAGNVYIDYGENVETSCMFKLFDRPATQLDRPVLAKDKLEYNFDSQTFTVRNWKDIRDYVTVLGANGDDSPLNVDKDFIGTRTVQIALRSDLNVVWKGDREKQLEIVELVIEVVAGTLPQYWELNEDGCPVLSFEDMDVEFDIASIVEYEYYDMDGGLVRANKLKKGVEYKAVASIKSDYAKFFCFGKKDDDSLIGSSEEYEFTFGKTDDEPDPDTPVIPPDPSGDGVGDNPSSGTISSLIQIIISGVSLILIIVFTIMTFNYAAAEKNAKRKAKKLAQMTYSCAPVGLLALALGISDSNWWVIAGVLMGVALLMAIVMFVFRGRSKKALIMLEEEQERIEEEKELAREADRERRDQEFKMMFAAMQQNYQQPQFGYDDMQNMIASAMTAMLPAISQMQALPPAQSDAVYNNVQSEADELRAQMAAQQQRMEAQMAQQQELINKLLENQMAQNAAPAYEEAYDEEIEATNARWEELLKQVDESEGIPVSLEESYGKLTDDEKRLYYEIGCYIMERPNVMQNDGKYAVLFKYRSRTLFKLNIKNDAPVLTYITDGAKAELRIADANALGQARQIIDMCIAETDRELDKY